MKVGRNAPCVCGSGKKFKHCCLNTPRHAVPLPREVFEKRHRRNRATYGQIREPLHLDFKGRKMVVVGHDILYSSLEHPWRTFHDFLLAYAGGLFGGERWATAEHKKPSHEHHPVYRMYEGLHAFMRDSQEKDKTTGAVRAEANSDAAGFLALAYDLFVVADNVSLQGILLRRLRRVQSYQGARYELFIAATMARAGFEIAYEDERDPSRKHPELIATHKRTGVRVAVEAKSRHRSGVLGQPGNIDPGAQADVRKLFLDALAKEPKMPFVVFIDVNLPPPSEPTLPGAEPFWLSQWEEGLASIRSEDWRRFTLVICTNFPYHYCPNTQPTPGRTSSGHVSHVPAHPLSAEVLADIGGALRLGLEGKIPHEFPSTGNESLRAPPPPESWVEAKPEMIAKILIANLRQYMRQETPHNNIVAIPVAHLLVRDAAGISFSWADIERAAEWLHHAGACVIVKQQTQDGRMELRLQMTARAREMTDDEIVALLAKTS